MNHRRDGRQFLASVASARSSQALVTDLSSSCILVLPPFFLPPFLSYRSLQLSLPLSAIVPSHTFDPRRRHEALRSAVRGTDRRTFRSASRVRLEEIVDIKQWSLHQRDGVLTARLSAPLRLSVAFFFLPLPVASAFCCLLCPARPLICIRPIPPQGLSSTKPR